MGESERQGVEKEEEGEWGWVGCDIFMCWRHPGNLQYNMSNTFVKLPTGDIEIEHIREMYEDLKGTTFRYIRWKPRSALVDKNGKTTRLYRDKSLALIILSLQKMAGRMTTARFVL